MPLPLPQMCATYKCEGCGVRARAPAPYGGFRHTVCSDVCLVEAKRRGGLQAAGARHARLAVLLTHFAVFVVKEGDADVS